MEISTILKEARLKQGLTQQELADKVYVTRQTISKWELGKSVPDRISLELLHKELDISQDDRRNSVKHFFTKEQFFLTLVVIIFSPGILGVRFFMTRLNQLKDRRLTLFINCLLSLLVAFYLKSLKDSLFAITISIITLTYFSYRLHQLNLEKME